MERKDRMTDEGVALNLVKLYFEEIARLGFKRKVDLDTVINAYFYTLDRLGNKVEEMDAIEKVVQKEELRIKSAKSKEDLF